MKNSKRILMVLAAILLNHTAAHAGDEGKSLRHEQPLRAVLWHEPVDIASRNLFYGPGGRENSPHGPYVFLNEDLEGSNPKFNIRDGNQGEWKAKLGLEARPETVASRLVWAVGYFTGEDYFLPELKTETLPPRLHRGRKLVTPDGSMLEVRLKRHMPDEKKVGAWQWRDNTFVGTRELNGLRVMMALINNWDLKDVNNAIYRGKSLEASDARSDVYMVSDLGASFGSAGLAWPLSKSRGSLKCYGSSRFISRTDAGFVDFNIPHRPSFLCILRLRQYVQHMRLRWLGRHIPRTDARWIGQLLARLSPDQIRDAFRAAGYSPQEVEGFTQIVLMRIAELNHL